jgi:hypothetical protein
MKCQKCGAENPEQVEFCTDCGGRIKDAQSSSIQPRKSWVGAHRWVVLAIANVVIVVLLASVLMVFLRDAGIRDHDGDGIADWKDSFPRDSRFWSVASGTINITVVNEYGRDLNYTFRYHTEGFLEHSEIEGTIANGSSFVETLVASWPTGDVNTTYYHITVLCYYYGPDLVGNNTLYDVGGPGTYVHLSPDQIYQETLTIRRLI